MDRVLSKTYVVSAPSGAGKTTLNSEFCAKHPSFQVAISHTTRPIRAGEVDGVNYHFVSHQSFTESVQRGEMVEWARVHDNFYGTSKSELRRIHSADQNVILEIDVQGWRSIKQLKIEVVSVFIMPPSILALWNRLESRGTDSEQVRLRRLQNARGEIEGSAGYDFFVENDELNKALRDMDSILIGGKSGRLTCEEGLKLRQKLLDEYLQADWIKELKAKYSTAT